MTPRGWLLVGIVASLGAAEIYHGPMGAADRLERRIESAAREELDRNEMGQIQAELKARPLSRTLVLTGPADDFQRGELVRVLGAIPGVARVEWHPSSLPLEGAAR